MAVIVRGEQMAEEKQGREIQISPEQLISLYQNQRAAMDSLLQQEGMMQASLREIVGAEEALKEIKAAGKDVKVLFLLGAGVFVEGEVRSEKVKSEVGGGVVQSVTVKKALEQLEEKRKKVISAIEGLGRKKRETGEGLARMDVMLNQFRNALKERQKTPNSVS